MQTKEKRIDQNKKEGDKGDERGGGNIVCCCRLEKQDKQQTKNKNREAEIHAMPMVCK